MADLRLSEIRLTPADAERRRTGVVAWVRALLNEALVLDGLTLRRHADGRLGVSWPGRRDRSGRMHHVVRPLDDDARRAVEDQILAALHEQAGRSCPAGPAGERPRNLEGGGAADVGDQ